MKKKYVAIASLFFVVALLGIGCGSDTSFDRAEKIFFQNRSGIDEVSCFIDDKLMGTVNSGDDLVVEGNYEGDRVLRAETDGFVWGPHVQLVDDGASVFWELTK